MNKRMLLAILLLLGALRASAQVLLNDFSAVAAESILGDWNASQASGHYTFTGTTSDESGVEFGGEWDLTGLTSLAFTAQVGGGNEAGSFIITLFDDTDASAQSTFSFSSFETGAFTTVVVPWATSTTFNAARVARIRIGGGEFMGSAQLALIADNLTATASAIPEPSTYAALFGAAALGLVAWRRRTVAQK